MEWDDDLWWRIGNEVAVSPADGFTNGWMYLHPLKKQEHRRRRR